MRLIKSLFLNKNTRRKVILLLLSSLIITFFQVLGHFLLLRSGINSVSYSVLLPLGICWFILFFAFMLLIWMAGRRAAASEAFKFKPLQNVFFNQLIILIAWLPCFLAYFPGIYSYDGEPQLIQYTERAFDNHHPIVHTYILGICYDFGQFLLSKGIHIDGLAFYTILQMLLLSFAFAYLLCFMQKQRAGRIYLIISMIFICFFPTNPLMAISSTKDVFFTAFFLLFITELLINQSCSTHKRISSFIRLFIFAVGSMFFRRNGLYVIFLLALACLFTFMICLFKRNREHSVQLPAMILVLFLSAVVFVISERAILNASNALPGESAEALSIPLQQMARTYKSNDEAVREKYGDRLFKYVSELGLANYRPLITDAVKQQFNNELFAENKSDFIRLYIDMGLDYPGSYVLAALYLTQGDWDLFDRSYCEVYKDWWRDRRGYLITDANPVFALGYVKKENLLPKVRNLYEAFATDCAFFDFTPLQILCSPAFYVILTLLGSVATLSLKKRRYYMLAGTLLFYLLTMLAGPCVLVRYIYPLMSAMPLFGWCVLNRKEDENE